MNRDFYFLMNLQFYSIKDVRIFLSVFDTPSPMLEFWPWFTYLLPSNIMQHWNLRPPSSPKIFRRLLWMAPYADNFRKFIFSIKSFRKIISIKILSCIISIKICKSLKVVEIKVLSFLGVKIHSKLNLKIRIKI